MSTQYATHKLYHFKYSICSIMVRYTFALRGEPAELGDEMRMIEEEINIMKGEQLTEHFLCDINPAGEVPVLAAVDGKTVVPDSLEITKFLSITYPNLIPTSNREEILDMLKRLHAINFFSLTYAGKPQSQERLKAVLQQRLDSDISPRYREAIEKKIKRIESNKLNPLLHDNAKANEDRAVSLMREFDANIRESRTGFCFGFEDPTALDAHLVVFIARMLDIRREDIIPPGLRTYADRLMEGEEWKSVMQGRSTLAPE